jgi:hypothetical protein
MIGIVRRMRRWPQLPVAALRRIRADRAGSRGLADPAADKGIRRLTAAAVLLVAAIAAVVSFIHIEHLAATHGQTQLASWLLPVSVDGTVAAASLSMLWAARTGLPTPWLARVMLGLGVAATLAANVAYGAPYGLAGELLSGWPAIAFVGSVEMVLGMVRRSRPAAADAPVPGTVPSDVLTAAKASYTATVAAGNPLSQNQLMERFGLTRAQATKLRDASLGHANGYVPVPSS